MTIDSATVTFAARNLDQRGVIRDLTLSPIISNMDTGQVYYTVELESGRTTCESADRCWWRWIKRMTTSFTSSLAPSTRSSTCPTCCISSARRSGGANGTVKRITRSTSVLWRQMGRVPGRPAGDGGGIGPAGF